MTRTLLTLLAAGLLFSGTAYAQSEQVTTASAPVDAKTQKQIEREWKKRLRNTKPLDFKQLTEQNETMKAETMRLSNELVAQSAQMDSLKTEVETLKTTVEVEKQSYNELMAKFEKANVQLERAAMLVESAPVKGRKSKGKASVGGGRALLSGDLLTGSSGVMFSVQVGVIERPNAAPKFKKGTFLIREESDGLSRIMMGAFRTFAQADNLKEQMRELGIRTAWVVAYKDGKRTKISSVLAELGQEPQNLATR